ncbi:hypothetical protein CYY_009039 [Polysphondylium violaceum]|uniref:PLD phosphodiesterase domain-containing protein n=1 Tax=Polysphondylium violaceum TaxID=133409 RepID=A0A8J4UWF6_9MYCE|nr:hypothetical protein CYY_009039 [Polysphondylium violaceum]
MKSTILTIALMGILLISASNGINVSGSTHKIKLQDGSCDNGSISIAESIPLFLNFSTPLSTHQAWLNLINNAVESIDMGIFYMTLTDGSSLPSEYGGQLGMDIFKALIEAHSRGVKIRIVQNQPSASMPANDTNALANMGAAEVRSINWAKLVGGGILHTKVIVVDQMNVYLGSANCDWRSLAQVKELGVVIENCKDIVEDTQRAFEQYWDAAAMTTLPKEWPMKDDAKYNSKDMAKLILNGDQVYNMFLAVSPPKFMSRHRTGDVDALVAAINAANKTVCISVMDYAPTSFYNRPNFYWPLIDDAIRSAAFNRNVKVRMLVSHWNHTNSKIIPQFLHSLNEVKNVQVRWFVVPDLPFNPQVPYTRVNHAKYMVTEQQSYVGTSNWSWDYFTNTGGLSYNIFNANFTSQLQSIFDRDWNSEYTYPINRW